MMRIPAALAAFGLGAAALLCSTAAQALGLGEVEVRSRLNERFAANIPLVSASEADLESLVIEVASPEAFARSGVERPDVVSSLSFARSGNGIRVTSREPIRDPFLTFIVEARWDGGRLLREYTVLLDPPGSAPAVPAPAPVPKAVPAPATPPTLVATPAPTPLPLPGAVAAVNNGRYGPVQPGQTLWSIAKAIPRTGGVTQEQMLLALYNGNPQAFAGGDIDHLLKGSLLKVPTVAEAMAIDAATAREQVLQLRASHAAAPVAIAEAPAAAVPAPTVTTPAPATEPVATEIAAPTAEPATTAVDPTATDAVPDAVAAGDAAPDSSSAAAETTVVEGTPDAGDAALLASDPPPVPAAVEPTPEPESIAAPPPAAEDGLPWLLIAALVLVIGALVVLRSRGRKREAPAPRRVSSAAESMPVRDALMDRPRTRPLVEEASDEAPTELKPLAAATDAAEDAPAADDAAAAAPSPDLGLTGVDAADPMTEADFHLAYGLYDEAAQMLKTAIAADPDRHELKVKLAEVYSAAGNAAEFQTLAQGLSGQVSASEWQKVSAMGRAILPDMALFRDPAAAATPETAPSAPLADALRDLSVVDFDLDADVRRPEPPAAATMPAPAAPAPADPLREALLAPLDDVAPADDARLDFPAAEPVPMPEPDPVPPVQKVDLLADIDLSSFDLDDDKSGQPVDPGRVEFTMADLEAAADEPLVPEPESEVIGGDEIDTKLDLARAYADMGDADAARTLLDEVVAGGTERQRQDAEALRGRLGD